MMCHDIVLVADAKEPLYQQLYQALRNRILSGRWVAGQRLPAIREFARSLGVSRNTVQQALQSLQAEGYLASKVGSGVFVAASIPDQYHQVAVKKTRQRVKRAKSVCSSVLSNAAKQLIHTANLPPLSNRWFVPGLPDLAAFPAGVWRRLWHQSLRVSTRAILSQDSVFGMRPLQQALCDYLRYARAVQCEPEQILITNGAIQALDLICRAFVNPGDRVVVEEPGYLGMRQLLLAVQATLLACPVDQAGFCLRQLQSLTREPLKLIYTTPTHQYPLGGVMPVSNRLRLLEFAAKQTAYVIEDDYDSEFHYTTKPPPSLSSLDADKRVLYVGSLSKVLTPLIRLGYLVVPEPLVDDFAKLKQSILGSVAPTKQLVLAEFIRAGHFARHLRRMRHHYAEKLQWMVAELTKQLGDWVSVGAHGSGMNVVVTFNVPLDDVQLVRALRQQKIGCKALSQTYLNTPRQSGLILGVTHMNQPDIQQGIAVIRRLMVDGIALSDGASFR